MIEIKALSKTFPSEGGDVEALKNVNIFIPDGDIYGIIGMSGAGKSTLVRCINMLERPSEGTVIIDGVDMGRLSDAELRRARREISMIFQGFNLLMQRNCLSNVCFPLELAGTSRADAERRAMELLGIVGLADKANVYPAQLSGGQQQRVAIARSLATDPKILLCDEATSALDPNTTNAILGLIREINERLGITAVVITHQMSVVESICNHVAILDGGSVVEEGDVGEIFSSPRSSAARRLVFPEGEPESVIARRPGERFIRLVFNGARAASTPLIAGLAKHKGIEASIAYASTRSIDEKAYGSMLLGIVGGEDELQTAFDFFRRYPDVIAEEVKVHG